MLIAYDTATGQILDNSGTNTDMPNGPSDDLAYVNTDARGIDRSTLALLRLNDDDDADLVAQILGNRCHVDPATKTVVIDGPYPVRSLVAESSTAPAAGVVTVTFTDTYDDAPAAVTFTVNGATATVNLTAGVAELDVTMPPEGDVTVTVDAGDLPAVTIRGE